MFTTSDQNERVINLFNEFKIRFYTYRNVLTNEDILHIEPHQAAYEQRYLKEIGEYKDCDFNYKGVPV